MFFAIALSTIPALTLIIPLISNAKEMCYATTVNVAQGPHPIPKGARRIIVDYNPTNGEVGVLKMGGPYRKNDFGSFSTGCRVLGIY